MKKTFNDYYVGFDIGTNSIGWATTDTEYSLLKMNGKAMWGVHLFEEGKTAAERRTFRSVRRRLARRAERLQLLRDFFEDEINTVDPDFLKRLSESKFIESDRSVAQKNTLFNDSLFNDKVYHSSFPTIYHLRSALITNSDKFDIRLIYLAIHHILKHRGHFLFEGQDFKTATSFDTVFSSFCTQLADYDIEFPFNTEMKPILADRALTKTDKQKKLKDLLGADTPQKKAIIGLVTGGTVKLADLFDDESLKEAEIEKISFSDAYEDKEESLSRVLDEIKMTFIDSVKALYDWAILSTILNDNTYLADAKKAVYVEHEKDLATLKKMVKKYCSKKQYDEIFSEKAIKANYCAYVNNKKEKSCSNIDFYKYLKKCFETIQPIEQDFIDLQQKIELGKALPKQVSKENGVIPYQLHLEELKQILEKAEKHYPFLQKKDDTGNSVSDKIKSIMTFRIPYYVGPLNNHSKFAWIERLEGKNEKIYPWNFDTTVDKEKSAQNFITRMTNYCTYIPTEKVLAKDSILYSTYTIYNQLNVLKIDGERISPDLKTALFNDLFLNIDKAKKVTAKRIKDYLKNSGKYTTKKEIDLSGIDVEIPASMKAYLDFKRILQKDSLDEDLIQTIDIIIETIVILGKSKDLLQSFLEKEYSSIFTPEQIAEIVKLHYSGWGKFSAKFLTKIHHTNTATGEVFSILQMLKNSNKNLMELLSREYSFKKNIDEYNAINSQTVHTTKRLDRKLLDNLYVSPAVKRSIWRTLLLCEEIVHITGHAPKKIFIEVAREVDSITKGTTTKSRKTQLEELYKSCAKEEAYLCSMIQGETDGTLQRNSLYLYYTQMGRCMYSGEPIEISDLYNKNIYDIDHIYPQSKVKDDSIMHNKVLVKKTINTKKGDIYPIPSDCILPRARELWKGLLDKNLISKEKYNRLTRKEDFSETELSGFIARQLVETRQSSKAVAEILTKLYPAPDTSIVYVKAGNIFAFRDQYGIKKSRIVNDYHHAKDAYLNIVAGNVYHVKFSSNPLNFIQEKKQYSMNRVFDFNVERNGKIAWIADERITLHHVLKVVGKNNILSTRHATEKRGGFFDQQPKKKGNRLLPLKTNDPRFATATYGGYNKISGAYFFLLEHSVKNKRIKTIAHVPIYLTKRVEFDLTTYAQDKFEDPKILIPKIKVHTLFKIDGFLAHLSCRTNNQLGINNAQQLVLSHKLYEYSKKIESYIERNKKLRSVEPISSYHKMSMAENIALYDCFTDKLKHTVYTKRLSSQIPTFETGRDTFTNLSIENQCAVLYEAFNLFNTTAQTADLHLIGGGKSAGSLLIPANIEKISNFSIINQSITGIFEKEINLKEL